MLQNTVPVLRFASNADIPKLSLFAKSTFIKAYQNQIDPEALNRFTRIHFSHEKMEKEMESRDMFFLMASYNSTIIGYSKFFEQTFINEDEQYDAYFIEKLYIHPELKSQGLGKLLLQEITNFSKKKEKKCVWLKVWERNLKAQSFYRKQGFQKASEKPFQMEWLTFNDYVLYKLI